MKKRYFRIGDFRRNVLLVSASACLGLTTVSCSNNRSDQEASTEWTAGAEQAAAYSQGVVTEMTEVSPNNWKITDERPATAGQVMAILKHQDGKVDTLQGLDLERRMQEYSTVHPQNIAGSTGMMDVLMWSGIGFMAGRMLSPNPSYYANPGLLQRNMAWRQQTERERDRGASAFRGSYGAYSRTSTSTGYREGTRTGSGNVRTTRPSSSRSGYFGGRSSGFGG